MHHDDLQSDFDALRPGATTLEPRRLVVQAAPPVQTTCG